MNLCEWARRLEGGFEKDGVAILLFAFFKASPGELSRGEKTKDLPRRHTSVHLLPLHQHPLPLDQSSRAFRYRGGRKELIIRTVHSIRKHRRRSNGWADGRKWYPGKRFPPKSSSFQSAFGSCQWFFQFRRFTTRKVSEKFTWWPTEGGDEVHLRQFRGVQGLLRVCVALDRFHASLLGPIHHSICSQLHHSHEGSDLKTSKAH